VLTMLVLLLVFMGFERCFSCFFFGGGDVFF